ncbi:hypothetical protein P170DRAFT_359333 [Aspergillus steynii IBT 23096]|uniref:Nitrogen regulatory protein areA GATA-like domain-containing protein n=1 Tax=Aspergillus steynii IBT 23096 TaxID=1392250 RepID=A0A2I2G6S3_9EURO|nr:uncharacterized protein P170DRAFT_359333 [Aspergillus steynii IBT 23096]PLB48565.1 hypothetical protein P170DRAFT_359333 [Aspergillus steynii IBT 23096]
MTAVLSTSREEHARFSPDPLRCPIAQRYFLDGPDITSVKSPIPEYPQRDCPSPIISSAPSSVPSSPDLAQSTAHHIPPSPTTLSSLSLNANDEQDEESVLLSDGTIDCVQKGDCSSECSARSLADIQRWRLQTPAADDHSIEEEPSRHVDYLSHEWKEEDIWASWRYVTGRRRVYDNGVRLENASWRTWAKMRLELGTVSPEALNWLKDCDVTWLYGPLKTFSAGKKPTTSPPPSCFETPTFYVDKKPILKKRTASETILQRSLSQHTLLQHAGAILKAQEAALSRNRPSVHHYAAKIGPGFKASDEFSVGSLADTPTNTSSGTGSPSERRHIHFNDEVVQCIAVEAKGDEDESEWQTPVGDELVAEEGVVMMKQIIPQVSDAEKNALRTSSSGDNKTIAPLPSTTLKYRGDTPEPPTGSILDRWTGHLSASSSSSRALHFSDPSADFFLDDEDSGNNDNDLYPHWESSQRSFNSADHSRPWFVNAEDEEELSRHDRSSLPSADENEQPGIGLVDRIVDTVNTARDIAHVIWNVGWRR